MGKRLRRLWRRRRRSRWRVGNPEMVGLRSGSIKLEIRNSKLETNSKSEFRTEKTALSRGRLGAKSPKFQRAFMQQMDCWAMVSCCPRGRGNSANWGEWGEKFRTKFDGKVQKGSARAK